MTLAREMETDINKIKNSTITQFLKTHLNKNATCSCELFSSEKQCAHEPNKLNPHEFSPLSCFFTFAPEPLAAELIAQLKTLKEDDAATVISTAFPPSGKTGFHNISCCRS